MKTNKLIKFAAIAVFTAGFAAGCTSDSTEMAEPMVDEGCMGATPEVKNAIYAAKLKNARVRNVGLEWRETAKLIAAAEKAAEECNNVRAKILADKAEQEASDAIAAFMAEPEPMVEEEAMPEEAASKGTYLVQNGDNLWSIAGQSFVYSNPYQWPLIYKANSGQIKDADLIYSGQSLDIPDPSDADAAAAVEHAKTRGAWTVGETEASDLDYLAQ